MRKYNYWYARLEEIDKQMDKSMEIWKLLSKQRIKRMKFDDNNNNRRVIAVDLDGVLTTSGQFWNDNVKPNHKAIEEVTELYKQGNIIIIWTARQWFYASETVGWLIANKVPFHGIQMAKGGADAYIDDKFSTFTDLLQGKTPSDIGNFPTYTPICPKCGRHCNPDGNCPVCDLGDKK